VSTRPQIRTEWPWIRSGPLFKVHLDAAGDLEDLLGRWPYVRIDLDGRTMTSREAAHAEIGRAFDFPDWYGPSWDGFADCMGHFVTEHAGSLVAVVWSHADVAAKVAPTVAIEVGWALLGVRFGEIPSLPPTNDARIDLDVFVTGRTPDFDRPDVIRL
jgi:RNAse (barnase) inhibitor barstar